MTVPSLRALLAALAALALFGCASAQDTFLLTKLDNQAKARALVDEGIAQYQAQLIRRGDLSQVASVREYFTMALRYDPQDLLAVRYRDLVDNFRASQFSQAMKQAQGYYAQERRSEDVNYAMLVAIQTALRLEPSSPAATRLAQQTESLRQTMIAQLLAKGLTSVGKAAQAPAATDRENADVDAWQSFDRVLLIDPKNATATAQMASLKQDLGKAAVSRAARIHTLVLAGRFDTARDQVAELSVLNRKVDGILEARVAAALYELDYHWARSLYAHRAYVLAEQRINDALRISATDEAISLKRRIAELAAREERQASFDDSLQQIDDLIQQGDLAAANARIEAAAKTVQDAARLDQLDARRQKVRSYLPQMYAAAVNDYRNENFKDAIDLLQTIVSIDVTYEQAADYLDKATAKEKLIEQY